MFVHKEKVTSSSPKTDGSPINQVSIIPMTTSKPRPSVKYNVWKDPRPTQICLGISLITVEEETFIQDSRVVTCPVNDDICYITVDRELIEVKNESCIKYDVVADILDKEHGYLKKHWRISHIWECVPEDQHPF